MTETEWNQSHPDQCSAYLQAWTNQQKREDTRAAFTQFTIAASAGVKISGRRPKLDDFLPEYAKPKRKQRTPEEAEEHLKAAFASLAKARKSPDGQK